ncbi:MAG: twin-arginine translocase TatA/TatE family subunit [Coriobacteriales bacterium]
MMRIPFLGGIGVPELIIILIVVLLIFGPKNLPKLGNAIGRTFKSLRDGMDGKKKDDAEKPAEVEADASAEPAPQAKPVEEAAAEEVVVETEKAPASKAE